MTVCAFTQKIVKFGEMMTPLGYDITLYSGEHNATTCTEHVPVFTDKQQRRWYGEHDPNLLPMIATWDASHPQWWEMNMRTIEEMKKRVQPEDLILLIAGWAQKPIADAFPKNLIVEWAVGYSGPFAPFRCYESQAWKHFLWAKHGFDDGRWYDTVIPNYFRPQDFSIASKRDDYLLFVGRIIQRKGVHVAAQVAKAAGRKLLIAGAGVASVEPGRIFCHEGFTLEGDHLEYMGVAGVKERNELMSKAHAVLVPTLYIEPFGAVAVEAQLCGTPTLTTDWGAFTETVNDGVTGFRFRTLQEGVDAVERVSDLKPAGIRKWALSRYSLKAVAPQYDRWLQQLSGLWHGGWNALR